MDLDEASVAGQAELILAITVVADFVHADKDDIHSFLSVMEMCGYVLMRTPTRDAPERLGT